MNPREDHGLTLIEVIVYVVISALVAVLIATLFAQGLAAQARSTERDRATGYANVISTSLSSLRNATEVHPQSRAVVATIITGSGDVEYRGWAVGVDGRFRYRESDAPIDPDSAEEWGVISSGLGTGSDRVEGTFSYSLPDRVLTVDLQVWAGEVRVDVKTRIMAQAVIDTPGGS